MLAFLAVLLAQTITLKAPDGAKPEDVSKAAKAMELRMLALGYQGISAKASGTLVVLSCASGFNDTVKYRAEDLAFIRGDKVELRFKHALQGAALEQFNGMAGREKIAAAGAPKGWEWKADFNQPIRGVNISLEKHFEVIRGLMVCSTPVINRGDFAKQTKTGIQFEVSQEVFKRFVDFKTAATQKGIGDCGVVVVDGDYVIGTVASLDNPVNGRSKIMLTEYARVAVEYPMPFSMTLERK